jgi:hypothetical protein
VIVEDDIRSSAACYKASSNNNNNNNNSNNNTTTTMFTDASLECQQIPTKVVVVVMKQIEARRQ